MSFQEMYDYINSLPGQPRRYDDSSIFRAFQAKFKNDQTVENEYKEHFDKNIDEETYELFYQWIFNKARLLNISIHYLLSFLYIKKIRNLTHHCDVEDFFRDSRTTFRYTIIDLLSKHDIQDVMTQEEVQALDRIFETYYAGKLNDVRQLQELAGADAIMAHILADNVEAHSHIRLAFDSNDEIEILAVVKVANKFIPCSKIFAMSISTKLVSLMEDLITPLTIKSWLIPLFEHMIHDATVSMKSRELSISLMTNDTTEEFLLIAVSALTRLAVRSHFEIGETVKFFLGFLKFEPWENCHKLILRHVVPIFRRAPIIWLDSTTEDLIAYANNSDDDCVGLHVLRIIEALINRGGYISPTFMSAIQSNNLKELQDTLSLIEQPSRLYNDSAQNFVHSLFTTCSNVETNETIQLRHLLANTSLNDDVRTRLSIDDNEHSTYAIFDFEHAHCDMRSSIIHQFYEPIHTMYQYDLEMISFDLLGKGMLSMMAKRFSAISSKIIYIQQSCFDGDTQTLWCLTFNRFLCDLISAVIKRIVRNLSLAKTICQDRLNEMSWRDGFTEQMFIRFRHIIDFELAILQYLASSLITVSLPISRMFFQKLQQTVVKLVVSPNENEDRPVYESDELLLVQIHGEIDTTYHQLPLRTVKQVFVEVLTSQEMNKKTKTKVTSLDQVILFEYIFIRYL
ncbi:unnamed protein product [Rotaria sp. Silwood2]|nr:unnamed protein product [Rotaria sp. Silwood2]